MDPKEIPAYPTNGPDHGVYGAGMTLRQYAAITLRVPDSGTDWLDDMIRKAQRDEFAAKAMQGEIAACTQKRGVPDEVAQYAYAVADAMLAAREGK